MHDQNFKNLILDYPVQALQFFAAEEAPDDLPQARIFWFPRSSVGTHTLSAEARSVRIPTLERWERGKKL